MSVVSNSATDLGQDASYIHRDIADTYHGDTFDTQIELIVAEVGMAVVPGHKLGSGKAALQVFAGNAELLVDWAPTA